MYCPGNFSIHLKLFQNKLLNYTHTHTLLSMESHQSLILKINCFSANKHIKVTKIEKNAFKVSVISHKSSQKQKQVTVE